MRTWHLLLESILVFFSLWFLGKALLTVLELYTPDFKDVATCAFLAFAYLLLPERIKK